MRIWCTAAFAAVLILSACSSGLSRQEYATSIESLIATMDDRLIEAGREYCGELPPEDGQGDCYTAETASGAFDRTSASRRPPARLSWKGSRNWNRHLGWKRSTTPPSRS